MLSYVASPEDPSSIDQPNEDRQVLSHTYYNLAGMASSHPFDGVNIVITRYTDGTQTATKVFK